MKELNIHNLAYTFVWCTRTCSHFKWEDFGLYLWRYLFCLWNILLECSDEKNWGTQSNVIRAKYVIIMNPRISLHQDRRDICLGAFYSVSPSCPCRGIEKSNSRVPERPELSYFGALHFTLSCIWHCINIIPPRVYICTRVKNVNYSLI